MSKVAAEKATGFRASRELPVIWAIPKGSVINKLILPLAFLLSAYLPWLIVPILLIGGAYLSDEGTEKVWEWIAGHEKKPAAAEQTADPKELVQREKRKIKAAVRTDFILSVEIIVIALLLGGGMYAHNVELIHHLLKALPTIVADLVARLVLGAILLLLTVAVRSLRGQPADG